MHQVERAIFDLRRGEAVLVDDGAQPVLAVSAEALDGPAWLRLRGQATAPRLVVTAERAAALGHEPADGGLSLPVSGLSSANVLALAAGQPAERPPDARAAGEAEHGALCLARSGALLPAVVVLPVTGGAGAVAAHCEDGAVLRVVAADAIARANGGVPHLFRVSEASVPLEHAESARFALFREANGLHEHLAIQIGTRAEWPDPVPVRLHSACLTGDLFGSLRCDCGEQLRTATARLAHAGGGVLLYLAQEGRGIGLANKLRAYGLQDGGLDTVDADRVLGFGADERHYGAAVAMLRALAIDRVRLFTNNPGKIEALAAGGIRVDGRDALYGRRNEHNARYLNAKAERAGHWLDDAAVGGPAVRSVGADRSRGVGSAD